MKFFSKVKDGGSPILTAVGDLHTNSHAGLIPPKVHLEDGSTHTANPFQVWAWNRWQWYWDKLGEIKSKNNSKLIAVFDGDTPDKNKHSHDELISLNPVTILEMAAATLKPALDVADLWYVVRGTPAHTGKSSWLEEALAKDIGAVKSEEGTYSWWSLNLIVNNVRFNIKHHAESSSTRPWTRGGGALRIAKIVMDNYFENGDPPPHVAIRNHFHHWEDSGTNYFTRAFILLPWQGDTAFTHRIGHGGNPTEFGGVYFMCHGDQKRPYDWDRISYKTSRVYTEVPNV